MINFFFVIISPWIPLLSCEDCRSRLNLLSLSVSLSKKKEQARMLFTTWCLWRGSLEGWPRKLEILGELKQSVPVFCCFCLFGFLHRFPAGWLFFSPFSDGLIYMRVVLPQFLVAVCNKIIDGVDINDITSVRSHVFRTAFSFQRSEETKRGRTNIKSKGLFHRSAHLGSLLLLFSQFLLVRGNWTRPLILLFFQLGIAVVIPMVCAGLPPSCCFCRILFVFS